VASHCIRKRLAIAVKVLSTLLNSTYICRASTSICAYLRCDLSFHGSAMRSSPHLSQLLSLLSCLLLTNTAAALRCHACHSRSPIPGFTLSGDLAARLNQFPPCAEFSVGDSRFTQACASDQQGCVIITDPEDETNTFRTCYPLASDKCVKTACYCTGDLCNAQAGGVAGSTAAGNAAGLVMMSKWLAMTSVLVISVVTP